MFFKITLVLRVSITGVTSPQGVVYPIELGFLGRSFVSWRIAAECGPERKVAAFVPWAFVNVLLFAFACWTMNESMDMRVTFVTR